MKIRSINETNINKLRNAFSDHLLDEGIYFDKIGLIEEGEEFVLIFETNKTEKGHVVKFEAEKCIGFEPEVIAQEVLKAVIEEIKKVNT